MARALLLGLPLHGHTNPTLPLVRALADRGDEIVYFSADGFKPKIENAGGRFCPYQNQFLRTLSKLSDRTHELSWLLMRTTSEVLASELPAFRAERPDYVIADSVAPWGQWVGQILSLPVVTSTSTFAINRHVMTFAASRGARPRSLGTTISKIRHIMKAARLRRQLRRQYEVQGTTIMGVLFGQSDLNIVYTSRYFQPRAETFDERFRFIGPSLGPRLDDPSPGAAEPTGRLIYVSLGTVFNERPAFYRDCFEALRDFDGRVVMSIGSAIPVESLGPAPSNFDVRGWVPQLDVLRRASAFVSHGGMNSVSESLAAGVPLVVVPQMGEQEMIAMRVEQLGAGLRLDRDAITPSVLREMIHRVLDDSRFADGAARVRRSFEEAGGLPEAVTAIQSFVESRRAARKTA